MGRVRRVSRRKDEEGDRIELRGGFDLVMVLLICKGSQAGG